MNKSPDSAEPSSDGKPENTQTSCSASQSADSQQQHLIHPIPSTADKPESLSPIQSRSSEKNLQALATELKRETTRAKLVIKHRATKYVEEQFKSELDAQALKLVAFDPSRLLEAPVSCRESLVVVLAHVLFIYAAEIPIETATLECQQAFTLWSIEFLNHVLKLLNLEESPAIGVMIEALNTLDKSKLVKSRSPFRFPWMDEEESIEPNASKPGSLPSDYLNPQPVKSHFLDQCDLYHKDEIEATFTLTLEKLVETVPSPRQSITQDSVERVWKLSEKQAHDKRGSEASKNSLAPPAWSQWTAPVLDANEFTSFPNLKPPVPVAVILRDLLLMLICSEKFDARVYQVFKRVSEILDVRPCSVIIVVQDYIAHNLVGSMTQNKKETEKTKVIRRLKIVAVAVGIGAATAFTAGLAAPAIASGVAALGLAGTSGATAFLASLGGSATIASVFGAGTAGLSGWKFSKRVGRIKVFSFDKVSLGKTPGKDYASLSTSSSDSSDHSTDPLTRASIDDSRVKSPAWIEMRPIQRLPTHMANYLRGRLRSRSRTAANPSLTVTICISGWLKSMDDICGPWTNLATLTTTDVFALRWDPTVLLELGNYLLILLSQKIAVTGAQFWLQHTIAGALSTALMWPVALIQYAATLDNTWLAAKERATQAGRLLAEALCDKSIGTRPVTLIGYSMGAKVIINCLLELHRRGAFHLVSNVILMGTPTSVDKAKWRKVREVVCGRVVNVFSCHDWILAFLYRYIEWGVSVAGLSPINVEGVENYDLKGLVKSHAHYAEKIDDILAYVGYYALPKQQFIPVVQRRSL